MTEFTYERNMVAHYGDSFVIVPDQIAEDQKTHDRARTRFIAYVCDMMGTRVGGKGGSVRVRLNGDAYGLWTPGTGDMRVTRQ